MVFRIEFHQAPKTFFSDNNICECNERFEVVIMDDIEEIRNPGHPLDITDFASKNMEGFEDF